MKKKASKKNDSWIAFWPHYYVVRPEWVKVDGDNLSIEPRSIIIEVRGIRYSSSGVIQDADAEQVEVASMDDVDKAASDLKDTLTQRFNERAFTLTNFLESEEMEDLKEVCMKIAHQFIRLEKQKFVRIERLVHEELIDKYNRLNPDRPLLIPARQEFSDNLKSAIEYLADLMLHGMLLTINQLANEARALSPKQKITKALVNDISEMIRNFRLMAMKDYLADGRGVELGLERFDRSGVLAEVEKAILNAYNDGVSQRDITQKRIADDVDLGDIVKGTGADVLRKRLRACEVTQSWGKYVDSVIKKAALSKRKSKKSGSKIRSPEK